MIERDDVLGEGLACEPTQLVQLGVLRWWVCFSSVVVAGVSCAGGTYAVDASTEQPIIT